MRLTVYAPVFVRPTETFIYDATTELAASDIDVTVIAGERQLAAERPFSPTLVARLPTRWNYARLIRRLLRPIMGRPTGGEAVSMQRAAIRRILQKQRPDVLLATCSTAQFSQSNRWLDIKDRNFLSKPGHQLMAILPHALPGRHRQIDHAYPIRPTLPFWLDP